MGRLIDRSVINISAAFVLYAVFISATGSIFAAVFLSFIAMCLLKKLCSIIPHENTARRRLRKARIIIEQLALTDAETAKARLIPLITSSQHENAADLPTYYFLRHPSQKTTAEDIAKVYRSFPHCPSVRIVSLANADQQARELSSKLQNPKLILTDGDKLASVIARNPDIIPDDQIYFVPSAAGNIMDRLFTAASRAKYGKCALTGIFMCLLFFISGTLTYLVGGCILLFISAVAFRHRIAAH